MIAGQTFEIKFSAEQVAFLESRRRAAIYDPERPCADCGRPQGLHRIGGPRGHNPCKSAALGDA